MPQLFVTTPVTRTFLCSYLVGWSFNWAIFTPRAAQPVITNALRRTIVSRDAILIIQSLMSANSAVLESRRAIGRLASVFARSRQGPSARSPCRGRLRPRPNQHWFRGPPVADRRGGHA